MAGGVIAFGLCLAQNLFIPGSQPLAGIVTADDCYKYCAGDFSCTAVEWNIAYSQCFPHYGTDGDCQYTEKAPQFSDVIHARKNGCCFDDRDYPNLCFADNIFISNAKALDKISQPSDCYQYCNAEPTCTSVEWNPAYQQCFPHYNENSNCVNQEKAPSDSGIVHARKGGCCALPAAEQNIFSNTAISGGRRQNPRKSFTIDSCLARCQQTQGCEACDVDAMMDCYLHPGSFSTASCNNMVYSPISTHMRVKLCNGETLPQPTTTMSTVTISGVTQGVFYVFEGFRYIGPGNGIIDVQVNSNLPSCESACLNNPMCTDLELNRAGNVCYLFNQPTLLCSTLAVDFGCTHKKKYNNCM